MMKTIEALSAIAEEAGAAARQVRAGGLAVATKAQGELLTSADRASHEIIAGRFAQYFPGISMVTEEGEHHVPETGAYLVADELDGTAPFAAGSKHWGVMVALVDGIPTHGVIHLPDLAVTITAVNGQGCRLNGREVNLHSDLRLADILLGAELNKHLRAQDWGLLQTVTDSVRAVRCMASAAMSAYELICGVTGAYINLRGGKIWDFAAPALAIREAGGQVCSPDGHDLRWDGVQMSFMATASRALLEEWLKAFGGSLSSGQSAVPPRPHRAM